MNMRNKIFEKVDEYRDEIVYSLMELLSFKSVAGDAEGDAPFGQEVQKAFDYMLDKAKKTGFVTKNVDNYGGHIDYLGKTGEHLDEKEVLGIPVHLDVVPAGNDWDLDPFAGEVKEGLIYGRGTTDNKGAAIAIYYAMKILSDLNYEPYKKIRMIIGLDEETAWMGMSKYLEKVEAPTIGFVPDADFPVIHGEMGVLVFDIAAKLSPASGEGIELRSLKAGNAANMVADKARLVIKSKSYDDIKALLDLYRNETGYDIKARNIGKNLEIIAKGISAHGAKPSKGLNAISIMMDFLSRISLSNDSLNDFIAFYNKRIGFDLHGERLGIALEDEPSGKLILNIGELNIDGEAAILTINVRYPVTKKAEDVYKGLSAVLKENNLGIVKVKDMDPIYFEKDHPLIVTLMEVYRDYTGEYESQPIVIGGGTYARAVPNSVAFGTRFPGEPEYAHQKNERISIEDMISLTKIYADAIYRLSSADRD